jgi:hypothetical protein
MRLPELNRWDQVAHRHHKNNTSGHHGAEITEQRRGHDGYSKVLAWMGDGVAGNYLLCYKPDAELTLQKHRKINQTLPGCDADVEAHRAERGKWLNSSRQASLKSRSTSMPGLFSIFRSSGKSILGDEYALAITLVTFSAFATT